MVHVPAKFRGNTAMCPRVSAKTKRDETDIWGHFSISRPGPSVQWEIKKRVIRPFLFFVLLTSLMCIANAKAYPNLSCFTCKQIPYSDSNKSGVWQLIHNIPRKLHTKIEKLSKSFWEIKLLSENLTDDGWISISKAPLPFDWRS